MKKALVILILLAAAAAGGWWYLRTPDTVSPARLVPADTMAFWEVRGFSEQLDALLATPMAEAWTRVDITGFIREAGASDEEIDEFQRRRRSLLGLVDSPVFREALYDDVALALRRFTPGEEPVDPAIELKRLVGCAMLVAKPRHKAEVVRSLGTALSTDARRDEPYRDTTVHAYTLDEDLGLDLYVTTVHGLLLATTSPETLHAAMDAALDPAVPSLADTERYHELLEREDTEDADQLFYMAMSGDDAENIGVPPFTLLQTFRLEADGRLTGHGETLFDPDQAQGLWTAAIDPPAPTTPDLAYVPAEVLYCGWSNALSPRAFLDMAEEGMDEDQRAEMEHMARAATGMELSALLDALGRGGGIVLEDVRTTGVVFPTPSLALMLEGVDEPAVARALETFIAGQGLPVRPVDIGGVPATLIAIPLGENLQPVYALAQGRLFVATSPALLERMFQAAENGTDITTSPLFTETAEGLPETASELSFVDVVRLTDALRDSARQVGVLAAQFDDSGETEAIDHAVEKLLVPFLDGLQYIQAAQQRGTYAPGELSDDAVISTR